MKALVLWDVSLPHAVLRYAHGSVLRPGDIILIHWRPNLYRDINVAIDAAQQQGLKRRSPPGLPASLLTHRAARRDHRHREPRVARS